MTVLPAKTQISLGIHPVWSESLPCSQWVAKDPRFLHADSEDWSVIILGGCPGWSESWLGAHAILLVLSWRSSIVKITKLAAHSAINKIKVVYTVTYQFYSRQCKRLTRLPLRQWWIFFFTALTITFVIYSFSFQHSLNNFFSQLSLTVSCDNYKLTNRRALDSTMIYGWRTVLGDF